MPRAPNNSGAVRKISHRVETLFEAYQLRARLTDLRLEQGADWEWDWKWNTDKHSVYHVEFWIRDPRHLTLLLLKGDPRDEA